jgi:hypothetical protein
VSLHRRRRQLAAALGISDHRHDARSAIRLDYAYGVLE